MGEQTVLVRVDPEMVELLEKVRIKFADQVKKMYKLKEVTVYGTLASQIIVAQCNNTPLAFKIRKEGLNKGVVEPLNHVKIP